MTIIPPTAPQFAIRMVDGDTLIGVTRAHEHAKAKQVLHRIQSSYPDSTLAIEDENSKWKSLDDKQVANALFQHTTHVLWFLAYHELPLAHWELAPWRADKLEGTIHEDDADAARKAIEEYAAVFGAEIRERENKNAICLELSDVVWGGVQIKLSTYTAAPKNPAIVEQVPAEA